MSSRLQTDVVIVGAGPCGLFQVFELGLLGLKAHIIDALDRPGGQCAELYPDKPIYDIPAIKIVSAEGLVNRLLDQITPFGAEMHLGQQVERVDVLDEDWFEIKTTKRTTIRARAVVVAGGVGSFQPRPLRVEGVEKHLQHQVFYGVQEPDAHHGKRLVVLGGGDSAIDWTNELATHAASLTLVHRSDKFRAAPASVEKMESLRKEGKVSLVIGNVTRLQTDRGLLTAAVVTHPDRSETALPMDQLLVFFGLSPRLGPIHDWGLEIMKNQINASTETSETNVPGIYAIGDIATYPGKKKLILSGFHEAALAAFAIKKRVEPDKKVFLQYTTTSPIMHQRLGVADSKS
ncbi:MAG: NAD(P)/FAD-dependent oxidoreductase [Pseudomonadales bacterium]|nr:NAD(P)/FAD-dependent oxidoreductase [Pseudomonadales bacterium]